MAEEWVESFEAFFAIVGERPSGGYSLGRIDNNGNYEPGNVEWQTIEQQANNKRNTTEQARDRAKARSEAQSKPRGRAGKWFWRGRWRSK